MEIQDRSLGFAVKILKFAEKMPKSLASGVLAKQLIRSATSIGANMEEADGASSKNDFINKVTIARKEARETRYWLRLIQMGDLMHNRDNIVLLNDLIQESFELMKVLSSIINKAKGKDKI